MTLIRVNGSMRQQGISPSLTEMSLDGSSILKPEDYGKVVTKVYDAGVQSYVIDFDIPAESDFAIGMISNDIVMTVLGSNQILQEKHSESIGASNFTLRSIIPAVSFDQIITPYIPPPIEFPDQSPTGYTNVMITFNDGSTTTGLVANENIEALKRASHVTCVTIIAANIAPTSTPPTIQKIQPTGSVGTVPVNEIQEIIVEGS